MVLEIVERQISAELCVVELNGQLAMGRENQRIESLVEDLIKKTVRKVVFDLSGVDYIDSSGVGIMALASGKLREVGSSLVLVAPQGRALQLLNLTQMNLIMKVYPTLEEAIAGQ